MPTPRPCHRRGREGTGARGSESPANAPGWRGSAQTPTQRRVWDITITYRDKAGTWSSFAEKHLKRVARANGAGEPGPKGKNRIAALMGMLKDKTPGVSNAAALALGKIGAAAVPALIKGLQDAETTVRARSAQAQAEMGPAAKAAIPALKRALKDRQVKVRWRAAYALVKVDDANPEEALKSLALAIQEILDTDDQEAAVDVLWRVLSERLRASGEPKEKR